jgi:hypothetical protein
MGMTRHPLFCVLKTVATKQRKDPKKEPMMKAGNQENLSRFPAFMLS